jgi:hypothetical protein
VLPFAGLLEITVKQTDKNLKRFGRLWRKLKHSGEFLKYAAGM